MQQSYFTLAIRLDGKWQVGFTDTDRSEVEDEMGLALDDGVKQEDLTIVETQSGVAAYIESIVEKMNAGEI